MPRRDPAPRGAVDVTVRDGILDLLGSKVDPANLIAAIERARAQQPVSTVFCTGYPVNDSHLSVMGLLVDMTVLGLMQTKVTGAGIPQLASLPKLEVLDLTGCPLTGEGMDSLPSFKVIQKVRVSESGVPAAALRSLIRTSVTTLEMVGIEVTDDDLGSWILQMPKLEDLSISGRLLTPQIMKLLSRYPRKLHLRIFGADHLQDAIPFEERIGEHLHVILL